MISEELPFRFDVEKLQKHVQTHVLPLAPHMVGQFFGGWSVLSSNGSYLDGWVSGDKAYRPDFMPGATLEEKNAALGVRPLSEYSKPTDICHGYLKEVIEEIARAGLNPIRARLSLLKAHGRSSQHRDARDDEYAVRLHIPIFTNEKCTFHCEEGVTHFPADGRAHLIRVNRMHQVFNASDENRIHLMMQVQDTNGISQFHRYAGE